MRYTFSYTAFNNAPLLHTITVPSPTGTGTSTSTINYDSVTGNVSSRVDANGNQWVYTYGAANTGSSGVQVEDANGNVVQRGRRIMSMD